MTKHFRYDTGRLIKVSVALTPLVLCPVFLGRYGGHAEFVFTLFGITSTIWLAGIVLTALRFRLSVGDDMLVCRGRFTTRKVHYTDIKSIGIRDGRDRAGRFVTSSPLRELVIHANERSLVLSSIPLGEQAMQQVTELLRQRLPSELWSDNQV
ncbi:MAG: hypothetical protein ACPGQS_02230 [Bradymonadia bacterium]